jgi:hypothetical protein
MIANAVSENDKNVHGLEAGMKKSMFRQLPNPLQIEGRSI